MEVIVGFIYKITNTINQKCYIGQTIKTLEKRFSQHKNNYTKPYFSQLVLYKAFKKYGIENFVFEEVEEMYLQRPYQEYLQEKLKEQDPIEQMKRRQKEFEDNANRVKELLDQVNPDDVQGLIK